MSYRVLSANVNGIRAAARKGFFEWLEQQNADIVCLQEVRATPDQLDTPIYYPKNYHTYFSPAEKKGYSGVAIYSKQPADEIITDWGYPMSVSEGRYIEAVFGKKHVVSLYLPSGTSGDVRQDEKNAYMAAYMKHLRICRDSADEFIIAGDWNIAHTKKDIKNWRGNQKNSGFLPEERAWLDQLFGEEKFVDAFRVLNQEEDQYSWWSQRGRARDNNVGWRIDYQVVTPNLKERITAVSIDGGDRFSDHAAVIVDYD